NTKMSIKEPKYNYNEIEKVFEILISGNIELTKHFSNEVDLNNYDINEDLPYIDIGSISRYIVEKKLNNLTYNFELFFKNVEEIYINGDKDVKEFIVIGLFEGIQNIGGEKIDYYNSFNKWLKPETHKSWNALIDSWEGTEWRIPKIEREKKKFRKY
ncbi:DUF7674 family protein, partial [Tenacibaculum dicentrarchi]|uniref:DUF7674 family protein n=1 Tax=Tenacibaculum dicentrarchi TaxID=669041 RepID=UPI003513C30A